MYDYDFFSLQLKIKLYTQLTVLSFRMSEPLQLSAALTNITTLVVSRIQIQYFNS